MTVPGDPVVTCTAGHLTPWSTWNHSAPGDPRCTCGAQLFQPPPVYEAVGRLRKQQKMRGGTVVGVLLVIIGAGAAVLSSNDHSVCQSVLVQAAAPHACTKWNLIFYGGIAAAGIGALMVVVAAIRSR